jgi:hypothetical protein
MGEYSTQYGDFTNAFMLKPHVKSPEKAHIFTRLHWNSAILYVVPTLARFTVFYGGLHQHSAYGLAFCGRI